MAYTLVWFKRDLRVHDHAPLMHAAQHGPVQCVYVLEPSLWQQPDAALQHLSFLRESLRGTDAELKLDALDALGQTRDLGLRGQLEAALADPKRAP